MAMAKKVKMLLANRNMTVSDLATKIEPPTSRQNMRMKINRDNLTESDLDKIAKACNASYVGKFVLNDTGEEI